MALVALAILVFASTNIDDLFVLLGFFADPKFRPWEVALGQYIGIAALFAVSLMGSLLTLAISREYVGLFGLVAIALGVKKLSDLYSDRDQPGNRPERREGSGGRARAATVALVTVANGSDNIGVYAPTFAVHTGSAIAVFALVFLVMTGLWCLFANGLVNQPTLGAPIRRYGHVVMPFVLIGIGTLIMFEAGSFDLLLRIRH
jgi:cadmium resistance protein CadD (predicted permease)